MLLERHTEKRTKKKSWGWFASFFFSSRLLLKRFNYVCYVYSLEFRFNFCFFSLGSLSSHKNEEKKNVRVNWSVCISIFHPTLHHLSFALNEKKIRRIWKMNWTEIIVCCFHLFYNVRWLGWNVSFFKFLIKLFLIFRNCALRPRKMQMRRYSLLLLSMLAIFRFMCLTIPHNLAVNRMLLHRPLSISTPLLLWLQRV